MGTLKIIPKWTIHNPKSDVLVFEMARSAEHFQYKYNVIFLLYTTENGFWDRIGKRMGRIRRVLTDFFLFFA